MGRKNPPNQTRLDFDTDSLEVIEPLETKASVASYHLNVLKNPYTGNKRKMLPHIFDLIEKRKYPRQTFFDLFTGSGVVGAAAKFCGFTVFANDLMYYPYRNAKFLIENTGVRLTESEMQQLLIEPQADKVSIARNLYGDRFTNDEAHKLDFYRSRINEMFVQDEERETIALIQVLHMVMDSCFVGGRLNCGQVLADRSHRLSHVRNNGREMDFSKIPNYKVFPWNGMGACHKVFNIDAIELLLSSNCPITDILYIDPPYGGQQSDYSAMYAFFDEFISGSPINENEANRSKFAKSSGYIDHFRELLNAAQKFPVLILSYNDSSWSSLADIVKELRRFRDRVDVKEVNYSYNYRDQSKESKEYLISAE